MYHHFLVQNNLSGALDTPGEVYNEGCCLKQMSYVISNKTLKNVLLSNIC